MTGMTGDAPQRHWLGGCGGACCNSKAVVRSSKKAVKQAEKLELREVVAEEALPDESWNLGIIGGHVYDGERCIYCNVNAYDPGSETPCSVTDREGLTYRTETPGIGLPALLHLELPSQQSEAVT